MRVEINNHILFSTLHVLVWFIQGSGLLRWDMSHYKVTVGGVPCPIRDISDTMLPCEPSQDEPPQSDWDRHGGSLVRVN